MKNTLKRSLALLLVLLFAIPTFAFAEDLGVEAVSVEDIALVEDVATDDVVVEQAEEPVEEDNLLAEANEVVLGEEEIAEENEAEEEIAEANDYNVKFDLNMPGELGATVGDSGNADLGPNSTATAAAYQQITMDSDGFISTPATPVRVGYKFDGWYNGSSPVEFENGKNKVAFGGNVTLTAHWTAEPVWVEYYWKNASGNYALGYTDKTAAFNTALPNNDSQVPTIENNKVLDGWYSATNMGGTRIYVSNEETYPAGKTAADYAASKLDRAFRTRVNNGDGTFHWVVKLYAGYATTYRVSFYDSSNNDALIMYKQLKTNATIDSPHVGHTVAAGLSFKCWATKAANGTYNDIDDATYGVNWATYNKQTKKLTFTGLAGEVKLYSVYTSETYKITYNLGADAAAFKAFDAESHALAANATTKDYEVEYNSSENTVAPTFVLDYSKNKDVVGWTELQSSTNFQFGTKLTKNVTLYPVTKTVYWVHFKTRKDGTGGTSWEPYPYCPIVAADPAVDGGKITKPDVDPTYDNTGTNKTYKFSKWVAGTSTNIPGNTDAERTAFDFSKPITAETWLYASYLPLTNPMKVHIEYKGANGDPIEVNQYVEFGTTATAPTLPAVEGLTFDHWEDKATAGVFSWNTLIEKNYEVEAKYTEAKFTVTFDGNGGTIAAGATAEVKGTNPYIFATTAMHPGITAHAGADDITEPTVTRGAGNVWAFTGWYTDATCTTRFNLIDEKVAGTVSGEQYTKANASKVTGNMTLYAGWAGYKQDVTFNIVANATFKDGTTTPVAIKVPYGKKISEGTPAVPVVVPADGYSFAGWQTKSGSTYTDFDDNKAVESNLELYAKMLPNTYVVKFETNGGTAVAEQRVSNGKLSTAADYDFTGTKAPKKSGYKLWAWYDNPDFTGNPYFVEAGNVIAAGNYSKAGYTVTKNVTFYAQWSEAVWDIQYFDGDTTTRLTDYESGLDNKYKKVADGALLEKPAAEPSQAGKAFAGWYTSIASNTVYDFSKPVNATQKLRAMFVDGYRVNFHTTSDGTYTDTTTNPVITKYVVKTGTAKVDPGVTNLNTNYGKFLGWYDANPTVPGNTAKAFDIANTAITETNTTSGVLDLYAKYDHTAEQVAVTFAANGGTIADGAVNPVYIAKGTALTASDIPAMKKAGYEISGWKDANANDFDITATISANQTLTAQWKAKSYTATFMDGTTTLGTINNVPGSGLTQEQLNQFKATKTGYDFDNWYTNATLTSAPYTAGTAITGNITLYGRYLPRKQYVKLVLGNAKAPTDTTYKTGNAIAGTTIGTTDYYVEINYNGTLPTLKAPENTDSKLAFAGWYSDDQLRTPFDTATKIISNITLYAKYMNAVGITLITRGWTYDGTSHVGTDVKATAAAGNANETAPTPTLMFKVKGAADSTYTTTAPVNHGVYVVKASVPATATTAAAEETAEFTIYQKEVTLTWSTTTQFTYNGAEQAPTCTVAGTVSGESVTPTITGKGKAPGSYTATASLPETGNYRLATSAQTTCKFTIVQSTAAPTVSATVDNGVVTITVKAADGTVISTSTVKVGESGATDDFTITTKDNGDGTATVTLTAKPTAGFKLDKPIEVKAEAGATPTPTKPTGTSIAKLKIAKKKKVVASWTAVTDVDGYEVQYGLKKTKGLKTKDVPGATSASVTLKLKKGKRYYFRIRTYKKDATGTKVYSDWSKWKRSKKVK